ncbi:reverse transcriptase domain-containing protein [Tanacetum coccineum]|uniref:Reverse transcriptase domain-containing protein n=1 Tax=Tanacetum coccineum TaxID=301880 RepID=A0ABQ5A1N0_9ASTR
MKWLIDELPMLTAPMEKEELIVYLAAAKETVSVVLMTKKEAKQMAIYFVSRALRGPEINYTSMEKLVVALVYASKRLKRYFQAHPIIVITDQPIQQVFSKPEVAGRLQSIELGEYAIHYRPRVSVKGQILANFIVERPEEESPDTLMEVEEELPELWTLFTDGSSCTDAGYEALIAGLRIAEQMGVKNLQANVDSRLVANQVNGTYVAKEADMIRYLEKVRTLTSSFKAFSIRQVPRSENKKADALSKIASTSFAHLILRLTISLEPLSLSFDFVFLSEIFKSLSFCLDRLCHLAILCLDQHAHTLHHLESLLTISLDRLDIFEGRSCISEFVRKSLSLILELS